MFTNDFGVYIVDDEGEVISWNMDEIQDDKSGFAYITALNGVILATAKGASELRANINNEGNNFNKLVLETFNKIQNQQD